MNLHEFMFDEIVDIKLLGEDETVDITVRDTHMFYANGIYTHNSSMQDEVIQADKIAESYQKIMTSDFVMSISRKLEDKPKNIGRAHIVKNRFGIDGQTYKMHMHTGMGVIRVVEENSAEDLAVKQQLAHPTQSINDLGTGSALKDFYRK